MENYRQTPNEIMKSQWVEKSKYINQRKMQKWELSTNS